MKVHFKLNPAKSDSDGYASVVLHALWKNYKFQFYTSERILPKYWNQDEQRVRRSHPKSQEINNYLDGLNEKVKSLYRGYLSGGIIPIPALLKNDLIPSDSMELKATATNSISVVFEKFISSLSTRGNKKSSIKHYRKLLNHLITFEKVGGMLEVSNFTNLKFDSFVEFMKSKRDYHPNTIGNWIKYLKSFLNYCKESGYDMGLNPAKLKKIWVEPEKIYLTLGDINKLLIAPVTGRLEKIRDVFVFACFTGLRYSDFSKIVNESIIEKDGQTYLSFIPQKTNSISKSKVKRVEIPLVPIVLQILQKYKDTGAYALPVMSNQKMNDYLKELGQTAGIDNLIETTTYRDNQPQTIFVKKYEKITCHVARHTFATLGLLNKIPLAVVSQMLGHSDLKTTMIYAKVVDELKNEEMTRAFGNLRLN